MTGRPFRPRPAAISAAGQGPAVRAVILVRLDVDHRGWAELPRRWRGARALPPGTLVRVDAGPARHYLDHGGELARLVRDCAHVEIVGTEPDGVTAVRTAITRPAAGGRGDAAC